ncbi:hypothetical protein KAW18_03445 [candidate division WOR-3 bacterium]|nr:hypothetical protein [candidate division WOR-3 bacterium]
MDDKMKFDFPEDFYEKLGKSIKKKKGLDDYIHDWVPLFVSLVTLGILIWVSLVVPYKEEVDLRVDINKQMEIRKKETRPKLELLIIPISIYNYGKTVVLEKYADIVFIGDEENKFSIQGLFQKSGNLRIDSRGQKELVLNVTNRSLSPYIKVKSFHKLMGKVDIQIKVTVRNRTVCSDPIEFSYPNVVVKE